jgi:anti-sigma factor RsiW
MTEDNAELDAKLVALIDNELDENSRTALLARLSADERLRQRYEELRQTGAPLGASFDALLEQAPLARLRAAIPADELLRQRSRRFGGLALRELAAGVVIGLLAAGAAAWGAWNFGLLGERENWRTAVVEYTDLYTNETFSPLNPDAALQAAELSAVGARVGANLTPENIALPGLRFTVAFMLSYEGAPLAVIAYVDPTGAPVLLCILADKTPDAPMRSERRGNLSLAWWSRSGRSHLVIGHIPEERAVALAQMLEKRV